MPLIETGSMCRSYALSVCSLVDSSKAYINSSFTLCQNSVPVSFCLFSLILYLVY